MYIKNNQDGIVNKQIFKALLRFLPLGFMDKLLKRIPQPLAENSKILHLVLQGDFTFNDLQFLKFFPSIEEFALSDFRIANTKSLNTNFLNSLQDLKHLYLSGCNLKEVSWLEELPYLTSLDLSDNPIENFSGIAPQSSLKELDLSRTPIEKSDYTFLDNLLQLEILHLETSDLNSLEILDHTPNIQELTLSGNPIEDLSPLLQLSSLRKVDLYSIPDLSEHGEIIKALEAEYIEVFQGELYPQ